MSSFSLILGVVTKWSTLKKVSALCFLKLKFPHDRLGYGQCEATHSPSVLRGGMCGVHLAYHNLAYANPLTINSILATEMDMVL